MRQVLSTGKTHDVPTLITALKYKSLFVVLTLMSILQANNNARQLLFNEYEKRHRFHLHFNECEERHGFYMFNKNLMHFSLIISVINYRKPFRTLNSYLY